MIYSVVLVLEVEVVLLVVVVVVMVVVLELFDIQWSWNPSAQISFHSWAIRHTMDKCKTMEPKPTIHYIQQPIQHEYIDFESDASYLGHQNKY